MRGKAYGLALSVPAAPGVRTLILGEDGAVTAVNAETNAELWRGQVHGEAREIAIADSCLFVGTHTGEISCFGACGGATGGAPAHPRTGGIPCSRG